MIDDGLTRTQRYFLKHREEINQRKKLRRQRADVKAQEKAYIQSPHGKELSRIRSAKFLNSTKGKEYRKKYAMEHREYLRQLAKVYHARADIRAKERKRVLLMKYGENGLKVFERDNYKCQKCQTQKDPEVHHIDFNRENNTLENLAVLCSKCHQNVHRFIPMEFRLKFFELFKQTKIENGDVKQD